MVKSVGRSINEHDNPISKLKSVFMQTACSKRDKGRPEVARSIMGEHLYRSTFKYKTYSLDYGNREVVCGKSIPDENQGSATRKIYLTFLPIISITLLLKK